MFFERERRCIFFSVDSNFYHQVCISLNSIKKNYKEHPDIIICSIDLSQVQKEKLNKIIPIIFINTDLAYEEDWPIMKDLQGKANPLSFWSRFLIWKDPVFLAYEKILYLDADTIVLKPLDYIFKFDFYIEQDLSIGGENIFFDTNHPQLKKILLDDKIMPTGIIANAGVFCIGSLFRTTDTFNELMTMKDRYKKYIKYADQSILNLWLIKNHISISENHLFNFQYSGLLQGSYLSKIQKAHIIHFNGINMKDRRILMYFYFLFTFRFGFLLHICIYLPLMIKTFFLKVFTKIMKYAY